MQYKALIPQDAHPPFPTAPRDTPVQDLINNPEKELSRFEELYGQTADPADGGPEAPAAEATASN